MKEKTMKLPVDYTKISPYKRKLVREEYIRIQNGLCSHCKEPLKGVPSNSVMSKQIDKTLFPIGFFNNPIHLHHNHYTGLTIGAVHCQCNAYLWQYKGE